MCFANGFDFGWFVNVTKGKIIKTTFRDGILGYGVVFAFGCFGNKLAVKNTNIDTVGREVGFLCEQRCFLKAVGEGCSIKTDI